MAKSVGKLKSQNDLGVQANSLYNRANGNAARQRRILTSFSKMNGRMGRLGDGKSGSSFTKYTKSQRTGAAKGLSAG